MSFALLSARVCCSLCVCIRRRAGRDAAEEHSDDGDGNNADDNDDDNNNNNNDDDDDDRPQRMSSVRFAASAAVAARERAARNALFATMLRSSASVLPSGAQTPAVSATVGVMLYATVSRSVLTLCAE